VVHLLGTFCYDTEDMKMSVGKLFHYTAREVMSLTGRLAEKIKDKYIWTTQDVEECIGCLIYLKDVFKKDNRALSSQIFGESGDFFEVKSFQRGYNTKSITFKTIVSTSVKKWVLKVGHRISPVIDFGDPSEPEYAKTYDKYLHIIRSQVKKHPLLSYLIPEPQEVCWAHLQEEAELVGRTLILQPYILVMKLKKLKLSAEEKAVLQKEFIEFKKLCDELVLEHKVRPDLMGEGNLEVAKLSNGYHLVLLDMGFVNLQAPLPITQTVMHIASLQTFYRIENFLRK